MLSEYEKAVLKRRGVKTDDIESVDLTPEVMTVKMKNGDERRLVECFSRVMGF